MQQRYKNIPIITNIYELFRIINSKRDYFAIQLAINATEECRLLKKKAHQYDGLLHLYAIFRFLNRNFLTSIQCFCVRKNINAILMCHSWKLMLSREAKRIMSINLTLIVRKAHQATQVRINLLV